MCQNETFNKGVNLKQIFQKGLTMCRNETIICVTAKQQDGDYNDTGRNQTEEGAQPGRSCKGGGDLPGGLYQHRTGKKKAVPGSRAEDCEVSEIQLDVVFCEVAVSVGTFDGR